MLLFLECLAGILAYATIGYWVGYIALRIVFGRAPRPGEVVGLLLVLWPATLLVLAVYAMCNLVVPLSEER
jgi:hypothetical protein